MIRLKCKWPGYLRQADGPGCVSRMSEIDKNPDDYLMIQVTFLLAV